MEESINKLAEIAKLAGEVLQNSNSDANTKAVAGNIQQMAMQERGRLIENGKNKNSNKTQLP